MIFENQPTLSKESMTLNVLNKAHEDELAMLSSDRMIWEHAPEEYCHPKVFKEKWFDKAIKQMADGKRICFVIFYNNKMIGSSSYYKIDLPNKKANIGYTWIHPSVWGTKANALSKLIMLEYAFEILKFNRIGFFVDSHNERSCRSLEKYGIEREGILRNHLVLPNRVRHSVVFSVINSEWEKIKVNLMKIVGIL